MRVSVPAGLQGWKLHITSIPTEAERLLDVVLPLLREAGVPFKIARDRKVLELLNSGRLGPTQVGKFVTVYPDAAMLLELAQNLRDLTAHFHGPVIPSDIRLGSVLYSRYGSFSPLLTRDRLGHQRRKIRSADGGLVDDVYRVPHSAPAGVETPFFTSMLARESGTADATPHGRRIFGPGYLLLDVLNSQSKGSIFLALDVRSQEQASLRVLKQGRKYCMSDEHGRDVRWRLRRELEIHHALEGTLAVPRAFEYFEVDEDGYLVLEHIVARNIEAVVDEVLLKRPWSSLDLGSRRRLLNHAAALVDSIAAIHRRGFVHRDISVSNVHVTDADKIMLFDLEMAHRFENSDPTVGLGTQGFIAPECHRGAAPSVLADIYSLGCVLAFILTGIDPRRIRFSECPDRERRFKLLTGEASELAGLLPVLAQILDDRPEYRPSLPQIRETFQEALNRPDFGKATPIRVRKSTENSALLEKAIRALTQSLPRDKGGLWLSLPLDDDEEEVHESDLIVLRSAHRGVAGVIYLAARLASSGRSNDELDKAARSAIEWMLRDHPTPDDCMPGLHFGEAGVAVALNEATRGGLVKSDDRVNKAICSRLAGQLNWPDITHGAAGQGVAAMLCAPDLAVRCAEYLIRTQEPDGSWTVPNDFPSLSGQKLTGFAHGAAGIIYFLAAFAQNEDCSGADRAWRRGMKWLQQYGVYDEGGTLEWPYSNSQTMKWAWWCHGGPGIALSMLWICELTGEHEFLKMATAALQIHPDRIRHGNLSQCHGLTGLGEIYLEAYRFTKDDRWLARAHDIAETLSALAFEDSSGCATWPVNHPGISTAELYLGCAGVVHFLLRLAEGPDRMGFPLMSILPGKGP